MRKSLTVTQSIAAVTTAVSVLAILTGLQDAVLVGGFFPARFGGSLAIDGALPAFLTPFSAELLHGGWAHLAINIVMLIFVGQQVERVVGGAGLMTAYVTGAVFAAAAQWAVEPSSTVPMVGASGAISALFGLYSLFYGRPPQVSGNQKVNRALHVVWLLAAWVVVQWMTAYLMSGEGVLLATPAHIGGFVAGLLLQRPLLLWRYRDA